MVSVGEQHTRTARQGYRWYPETHLILWQAKRMGTECVHGKELVSLIPWVLLTGFGLHGSFFFSTSCKFSMIISLWNYLHCLYCFFKWRVGFNSDFSITSFLLWENVQLFQSIMVHTTRCTIGHAFCCITSSFHSSFDSKYIFMSLRTFIGTVGKYNWKAVSEVPSYLQLLSHKLLPLNWDLVTDHMSTPNCFRARWNASNELNHEINNH